MNPATEAAWKLRRKLQALAERGVDGEKAAALAKLARLEARYNFTAPEPGGPDLFAGSFVASRGNARFAYCFRADESDIAGLAKWAVEIRTGIACQWRGNDVLAEAEHECVAQIARILATVRDAFASLWERFSAFQNLNRGDRRAFMLGLYDGMMGDEIKSGTALPKWTPPKTKKTRVKASAAVATMPAIHPYSAAIELGRRIRLNVPLADIARFLEAEILRIAA